MFMEHPKGKSLRKASGHHSRWTCLQRQEQEKNRVQVDKAVQKKMSAEDVSQLLQTADEAGLDFGNPIPKKKKLKPEEGSDHERNTNAARSLDRWLRRSNTWPKLYWAKVPMKNPKQKVNDFSQQWLPFLLPHEWLSGYGAGAWAEARSTCQVVALKAKISFVCPHLGSCQ